MNINKLLDIDLSGHPPSISLPRIRLPGGETDQLSFHRKLTKYDYIDIATYTISISLSNINRCLFTKSQTRWIKHDGEFFIQCDNIHAKIIICYRRKKPVRVYIGSMNFVHSSDLIDIMIPIDRVLMVNNIVSYYNQLFESALSQCHS